LETSLHLGSPNHELSFEVFFLIKKLFFIFLFFYYFLKNKGSKPIDFPSKMVPCKLSLDLSLFGLQISSQSLGIQFMVRAKLFNLYFAFTHPVFLYKSPILITKYYDMSLLFLFNQIL